MNNTEINICPHCGGESKLTGIKSGQFSIKFFCECQECHAKGPEFEDAFISFTLNETKEKAIAAWNRRKPMDDIAERMEAEVKEICRIAPMKRNGKTVALGFVQGLQAALNHMGIEKEIIIPIGVMMKKEKIVHEWIYGNHSFYPDEEELFKKIEAALGFKLFFWQKSYILYGTFRKYGKTTAEILKELLATDRPPLDYSKRASSAREDFYRKDLRKIKEKLTAAGIPTRKVFWDEREKRYDGMDIKVAFCDDMHLRKTDWSE